MSSKSPRNHDEGVRTAMYVSIAFLLIAILPIQDYGYYILLRWIVMSAALYILYKTHKNPSVSKFGFILIALFYNPVIPVYLYDKIFWTIINFSVVGYYMYEMGYGGHLESN